MGKCYFCGESTDHTILVEDGVPFYHPRYFNDAGHVYVCVNWADVDSRMYQLASAAE